MSSKKSVFPLQFLAQIDKATNILLSLVAKFEYNDLLAFTKRSDSREFYYYNLHHNIWNEWGLLNFITQSKHLPIDSHKQLDFALKNKKPLIFPDKVSLEKTLQIIGLKYPKLSFEVKEWRRWKTRGKNKQGKYMWIESLKKHDLTLLSKKSYLLQFNI